MRKYFKGVNSKDADGWFMASCGNSGIDNQDYCIDTNSLHADQVPGACNDAKTFSQFASGLLNLYYNGGNALDYDEDAIIQMGIVEQEENIPHPSNPNLPF